MYTCTKHITSWSSFMDACDKLTKELNDIKYEINNIDHKLMFHIDYLNSISGEAYVMYDDELKCGIDSPAPIYFGDEYLHGLFNNDLICELRQKYNL